MLENQDNAAIRLSDGFPASFAVKRSSKRVSSPKLPAFAMNGIWNLPSTASANTTPVLTSRIGRTLVVPVKRRKAPNVSPPIIIGMPDPFPSNTLQIRRAIASGSRCDMQARSPGYISPASPIGQNRKELFSASRFLSVFTKRPQLSLFQKAESDSMRASSENRRMPARSANSNCRRLCSCRLPQNTISGPETQGESTGVFPMCIHFDNPPILLEKCPPGDLLQILLGLGVIQLDTGCP